MNFMLMYVYVKEKIYVFGGESLNDVYEKYSFIRERSKGEV